jgi:regulator of protease activity HflC (stomatin/prohibitin superfamily)
MAVIIIIIIVIIVLKYKSLKEVREQYNNKVVLRCY